MGESLTFKLPLEFGCLFSLVGESNDFLEISIEPDLEFVVDEELDVDDFLVNNNDVLTVENIFVVFLAIPDIPTVTALRPPLLYGINAGFKDVACLRDTSGSLI